MTGKITARIIMDSLHDRVEDKQILPPTKWLSAAEQLNVLVGDEHDRLFELEQQCAKMKLAFIEEVGAVSKAQALLEVEDMYREAKRQKAFIGQVEELIRIAKIQARMKDTEMSHY